MESVLRDLRQALRGMRRAPAFTVAAVLALGLGAGAATAVFSLLEGVVLRPLPYRSPERLVMLWDTQREKALEHEPVSPVNVMDYRRLSGVFEDVAAWWRPETNLVDEAGDPIRVPTVEASENLFRVLGVDAALGRTFPVTPALYDRGAAEAVISDRLWRSRFGGDPRVVGRTVRLNGFVNTIVGVMPPGFRFPGETDVWQRLSWDMERHSRGAHFMEAIGRLRPGVTAEQANRDLAALGARLGREFAATNRGWAARAVPLGVDVAGVFRPGLYALFGASAVLLLIACLNVANLLLARATGRRAEVAIRSALGASRWRLVRQILTESVVLAAAGAALGFGVAVGAVRAFLAWSPVPIPRSGDVSVNGVVLAFTAALTVATALVFGLAPALLASRAELQESLKDTSRGSTGERGGRRARGALVVGEIALAVALLSGAGLLIRSVAALAGEWTGVTADDAVTTDLQLPDADYDDWSRVARFYAELLPALRANPRITAAGASNFLPLEAGWRIPFEVVGAPPTPRDERPMAQYHTVDEGYFRTLGIRLLRGRNFDERDDASRPGVVIVNETLARRYWPGEEAVGKRLVSLAGQIGPLGSRLVKEDVHEVVGVVADSKNASLTSEPEPAIYSSVRQFPFRKMHVVLRGHGGQAALVAIVRADVKRLDPTLPLGESRSMRSVLGAAADPPRVLMSLMAGFAGLALALAGIGIYGILSYTVSARRREIGIRLALGARPLDVLRLVMREGLVLAATGAALGVAVAAAGGRLLSSLLYGVRPTDPLTLGVVTVLVLGVALVACAAPGRRAALTEPTRSLRGE